MSEFKNINERFISNYLAQLYFTDAITLDELAFTFGSRPKETYDFIDKLQETLGIKLKIDILRTKLGLRFVCVHIEPTSHGLPGKAYYALEKFMALYEKRLSELGYVRSISITNDGGFLIVFHLPLKILRSKTTISRFEALSNKDFVVKAWIEDFVLHSRPLPEYILKSLKDRSFIETHLCNEKIFDDIHEKGWNVNSEKILGTIRPFDSVDLDILKELEINSFLTLDELAKALNMRPARVKKHLRHAREYVYGYRVMWNRVLAKTFNVATMKLYVFKCSNVSEVDVAKICGKLIAHPYIGYCAGSSRTIILGVYAALHVIPKFERALRQYMLSEFRCDIMDAIEHYSIPPYMKKFSIPLKETGEYNPKDRDWFMHDLTSIVKTLIDVLKKV